MEIAYHRLYVMKIVEDLINTFRFVHPCEENLSTFSFSFRSIILSAASESSQLVNFRCREKGIPCDLTKPESRTNIVANLKLKNAGVQFSGWVGEKIFHPFCPADNNPSNSWWSSYNKIKHGDVTDAAYGSLENAMLSVSACILALGPHLLSDGTLWLVRKASDGRDVSTFESYGFSVIGDTEFFHE